MVAPLILLSAIWDLRLETLDLDFGLTIVQNIFKNQVEFQRIFLIQKPEINGINADFSR